MCFSGGLPGVPYIIFGPPGTGKTVTITEAIKQVWKTKPESFIVAAAPSNSAADLLALHLIKQVPKTQIVSINSVIHFTQITVYIRAVNQSQTELYWDC